MNCLKCKNPKYHRYHRWGNYNQNICSKCTNKLKQVMYRWLQHNKFYVMDKCCKNCLYGKNAFGPPKLVEDIAKNPNISLGCHCPAIEGKFVCCRMDFIKREGGVLGKMAKKMNKVEIISKERGDKFRINVSKNDATRKIHRSFNKKVWFDTTE